MLIAVIMLVKKIIKAVYNIEKIRLIYIIILYNIYFYLRNNLFICFLIVIKFVINILFIINIKNIILTYYFQSYLNKITCLLRI
jgi:hypothetical protein